MMMIVKRISSGKASPELLMQTRVDFVGEAKATQNVQANTRVSAQVRVKNMSLRYFIHPPFRTNVPLD
jgi:hypothetical protein